MDIVIRRNITAADQVIQWYKEANVQWRKHLNIPQQDNKQPRVLIVGQGGSGKTTFAAALASIINVDVLSVDRIAYEPGTWTKCSAKDLQQHLQSYIEAHANNQGFIIESIYIDASDTEKAIEKSIDWLLATNQIDLVVWINKRLTTRLYRILKRSMRRWLGLEQQIPGNVETWKSVKRLVSKQWNTSTTTTQKMNKFWMDLFYAGHMKCGDEVQTDIGKLNLALLLNSKEKST